MYICRFQLSSTSELHSSGQATTSQPETQRWSHLSPSFRRSPLCCAARPVAPHPTAHATTVDPAQRGFHGRSSAVLHHYAPSAPTALTAAREFQRAQRRVTSPQTPFATTAALARSTRIVGTAPTAPTAARGFQRHRPRLSAQRRAALSVKPRMAFATTAAPAQSTRIVGTAPTAQTAAPAPRAQRPA
jgi:hypothetical protein